MNTDGHRWKGTWREQPFHPLGDLVWSSISVLICVHLWFPSLLFPATAGLCLNVIAPNFRVRRRSLSLALPAAGCSLAFGAFLPAASAASLNVRVAPLFDGRPLVMNPLALTNAAGQRLSVTRLDFLLSDFALRRADGAWLERTNWQAYFSLGAGRAQARVPDLPPGRYDRARFHVGVRPDLNHSDPVRYAPDHPLNPELNGLHWGWAGGYVFFAIEGRWEAANSKSEVLNPKADSKLQIANRKSEMSGYSFHLGNDWMLMTVELPVALALNGDQPLSMALHVDRVFGGQPPVTLAADEDSTHSREGDALAEKLRGNVQSAFVVLNTSPEPPLHLAVRGEGGRRPGEDESLKRPLLASNATPYRFTFARQFPPPPLPRDNPLTDEGVELGRRLFHEPLLSINGKQACASCHQAEAMFIDAGRAFSLGAEGRAGTRNAMPLFNLAWKRAFFWDGRAPSLRAQVLMPIQNPIEMHESLSNVVAKLQSSGGQAHSSHSALRVPRSAFNYPALFERAFGSPEISADRVARALEQFLLTLVSYDAKFDRALQGRANLTEEEKRGFQLFVTEYDPRRQQYGADCFHCHGGPFFTTHGFANNGLDAAFSDPGLAAVTAKDYDQGKFSVPSLRNVELTAPYMHDGRFKTLAEVIGHYSTGVKRSDTLDPNLAKHPAAGLNLSAADKQALVAFLKTLTDETFRAKHLAGSRTGTANATGGVTAAR
ncbi:MAG: cytochrome C peroxidase [Pedosphaera parvula]|nr:cytochrome C peroxidase [Pedosphaera parvula]